MVEQMGALTSNRKRGDYCSLNKKSPSLQPLDLADTHIAKKPKLSSSLLDSSNLFESAKTLTSRIYRYPEPVNRLRREVHAPCRASRLGFSLFCKIDPIKSSAGLTSKVGVGDTVMGNVLSSRYDQAKKYAVRSLRYWRKDKEVIDVDDDTVEKDDSTVQEVEVPKEGGEAQTDRIEPVLKVESAEDLMQSLSIDRELDGFSTPVHKKLLETAERRNSKLSALSFLIESHEKRRAKLQLLRPVKKVEQEEEVFTEYIQEAFVPLTHEEEAVVKAALFSSSNRGKLLVNHASSNIDITGEIIMCLKPKSWLNDDVINLYLELLKEREKREPQKFLKCHFFNTFFYKKLRDAKTASDFKSLGRWTTHRKLGYHLVDCDKIFIPVHKEIHWCLAVINKKDQKFQYLDSLGGTDSQCLSILAKYYVDEVKGKTGQDIDVSKWEKEFVRDLPTQENGYDCGVFMIKYIDFYSRGVGLCFKQEDMPYFRRRTAKEILRLKAD